MMGKTPFQLYQPTYYMIGTQYYKITSSRAYGMVYKSGLSLKYDISKCIGIALHSEYTFSNLSFGFYNGPNIEYTEKKISFLDLGLALVVKI